MLPALARTCFLGLALTAGCASPHQNGGNAGGGRAAADADQDWRTTEAPVLTHHTQLTFPDRFIKAGEAYFSPNDQRVIFQAIERPKDGAEAPDYYAMFVADVKRDTAGRIVGLWHIRRLSPEGSANTCGWFDPHNPNVVYFGSTLVPPSGHDTPGYQRGTGRYRWSFPPEMRIVRANLLEADGTAATLETVVGDGTAYTAEGSISPDGRTLLYTQMDPKTEGDLWVMDLRSGKRTKVVSAPGYDGGPFFSPDGKRIIYRSNRRDDNLLQIFTADLVRDSSGAVSGVANERALTDNKHVNWCPYFHADGHHFVYGTSQMGHENYEVFMRDDRAPGQLARITLGSGADVLPVFSHDGKVMMWTAQRGPEASSKKSSQIWVADFDMGAAVQRMQPEEKVAAPTSAPAAS